MRLTRFSWPRGWVHCYPLCQSTNRPRATKLCRTVSDSCFVSSITARLDPTAVWSRRPHQGTQACCRPTLLMSPTDVSRRAALCREAQVGTPSTTDGNHSNGSITMRHTEHRSNLAGDA